MSPHCHAGRSVVMMISELAFIASNQPWKSRGVLGRCLRMYGVLLVNLLLPISSPNQHPSLFSSLLASNAMVT